MSHSRQTTLWEYLEEVEDRSTTSTEAEPKALNKKEDSLLAVTMESITLLRNRG